MSLALERAVKVERISVKIGSTRERRGQRVRGPRSESQVGKVVCHIFLKVGTLVPASRVCPVTLR